jgi:hypothetical protein
MEAGLTIPEGTPVSTLAAYHASADGRRAYGKAVSRRETTAMIG